MLGETEIALQAFRSGADGFILKHCAGTELVTAINEVMAGSHLFNRRASRETCLTMIDSSASSGGEKNLVRPCVRFRALPWRTLTNRQIEVLRSRQLREKR
jgi:DNA-binding NarL/FixJ family response regulator